MFLENLKIWFLLLIFISPIIAFLYFFHRRNKNIQKNIATTVKIFNQAPWSHVPKEEFLRLTVGYTYSRLLKKFSFGDAIQGDVEQQKILIGFGTLFVTMPDTNIDVPTPCILGFTFLKTSIDGKAFLHTTGPTGGFLVPKEFVNSKQQKAKFSRFQSVPDSLINVEKFQRLWEWYQAETQHNAFQVMIEGRNIQIIRSTRITDKHAKRTVELLQTIAKILS